jgi:hypothetical protein
VALWSLQNNTAFAGASATARADANATIPETYKMTPTPVVIRGIAFPSVRAAAEHFGVHRITVWRWLAKGQFNGSRKLEAKLKRMGKKNDQD